MKKLIVVVVLMLVNSVCFSYSETKYYCDKCHKETNIYRYISYGKNVGCFYDRAEHNYSLCIKCYEKIEAILNYKLKGKQNDR